MKKRLARPALTTLALAATILAAAPAGAQVAGSTSTVQATVTESIRPAYGWSVKKTLMGKTIYNDLGRRIGKVDDLIVSTDRNVTYVIVAAGGFIGIGRHDVAIPVSQIQDQGGKLVIPGATADSIQAMPAFTYAPDTGRREQFVAAADSDIASGRARVVALEKKSATAAADAKLRIDQQIVVLRGDVTSAETRLTEMKQATRIRWKEFEAGVNEATARLRKSIDTAVG